VEIRECLVVCPLAVVQRNIAVIAIEIDVEDGLARHPPGLTHPCIGNNSA